MLDQLPDCHFHMLDRLAEDHMLDRLAEDIVNFRRWLIQKRIAGIVELKRREKKIERYHMIITSRNQPTNNIKWIENGILKNPLRDHRKYIVWITDYRSYGSPPNATRLPNIIWYNCLKI
jgi:hypothetical protein